MNMIKVESLNKNIKGKVILKDISFEVAEGECVAMIGPNGAGKTTLLDCLLGDKLVSSGQVSIQGLPVTSSKLDYMTLRCTGTKPRSKRLWAASSAE